jgi:hypothetical protein
MPYGVLATSLQVAAAQPLKHLKNTLKTKMYLLLKSPHLERRGFLLGDNAELTGPQQREKDYDN